MLSKNVQIIKINQQTHSALLSLPKLEVKHSLPANTKDQHFAPDLAYKVQLLDLSMDLEFQHVETLETGEKFAVY